VARAFAEQGDRVLLVGRTEQFVCGQADTLAAAGLSAYGYACDLSDPQRVDALAARLRAEHGPALDGVVLMAGGFAMSGPVASSDPADLDRQLTINLRTAYLTTRSVLPMIRITRGALVYFASEAVLPGGRLSGVSGYGIAKGAVVTLMRTVAQEERASGVRANAVAPGSIRTATNMQAMGEATPFVEREEVARVVTFLCSDAGANITGETLHLAARGSGRVASSP
jgi:NAD(P)-dependent dehydrogenase (short-subunit alcohol dehydrogenase family)